MPTSSNDVASLHKNEHGEDGVAIVLVVADGQLVDTCRNASDSRPFHTNDDGKQVNQV